MKPDDIRSQRMTRSADSADAAEEERGRCEVERLLALSEQLLQQTERLYSRLWAVRTAQAAVAVVGFAASFIVIQATGTGAIPSVGLLLCAVLISALVVIGVHLAFVRPWTYQLRRDRRSLYQSVELLRQTSSITTDDWSPMEQAELEIRLSRFPIGSKIW